MSQKEMFEALHPDPNKQGTRVTKTIYDVYKEALLKTKPATPEGIEFMQLSKAVIPHVPSNVLEATSAGWWTTCVKLDLEARGLIERVNVKGRQRVRRVKS